MGAAPDDRRRPAAPGPRALVAAAFLTAGLLTAGFFTAGLLTAGLLTAGLLTAGFLTAGFLTAGLLTAGFFEVGREEADLLAPVTLIGGLRGGAFARRPAFTRTDRLALGTVVPVRGRTLMGATALRISPW